MRNEKTVASDSNGRAREPGTQSGPHSALWILLAAVFALFTLTGYLAEGTFTDDDLSRYLSARAVFEFPEKILGLWTRPAFMILYALPAQLGYWGVEVMTALVCTATCFFVYRAARRLDERNALLAVVFTAFQPLFFVLSYSALVEPLAALLIAIGLDLMLAGRMRASALVGSAIPLARLETALILGVWALRYAWARAWIAIVLLPLGVVLWNIAGLVATGDPLYLLNQIFVERERGLPPLPIWHYARGFIFIVGPVAFFFSILGMLWSFRGGHGPPAPDSSLVIPATPGSGHASRARHSGLAEGLSPGPAAPEPGAPRDPERERDATQPSPELGLEYRVITASFLVMAIYYSLSAWQSGALQSAGFFRHFVALAPLVSILALRGFNLWLRERPRRMELAAMLILPVLGWLFLSVETHHRYIVGDEPEYLKPVILTVLALVGAGLAHQRAQHVLVWVRRVAIVMVVLAALGYHFAKHRPLPFTNEQATVADATEWIFDQGWSDRVVLCNHHLFHVLAGGSPYHPDRYPPITDETLEEAPPGSIVIWEGHYGERGLPIREMESLRAYRVHRRFLGPERSYFVVVLEKTGGPEVDAASLTPSSYHHRGLAVRWDLADAHGWRMTQVDQGLRLVEGSWTPTARDATDDAAEPDVPVPHRARASLEIERFFRQDHTTSTFGRMVGSMLRRMPGVQTLDTSTVPEDDWYWIACRSRDEDSVIGVRVASERHTALKLVVSGPPGATPWLQREARQLASGLRFE